MRLQIALEAVSAVHQLTSAFHTLSLCLRPLLTAGFPLAAAGEGGMDIDEGISDAANSLTPEQVRGPRNNRAPVFSSLGSRFKHFKPEKSHSPDSLPRELKTSDRIASGTAVVPTALMSSSLCISAACCCKRCLDCLSACCLSAGFQGLRAAVILKKCQVREFEFNPKK